MIVCGIDLETTGLDFDKDVITEIAWIIKKVGDKKPYFQKSHLIYTPDVEISDFITELTGITKSHLLRGDDLSDVVNELYDDMVASKVDFIVAHNGENFDKPMLLSNLRRIGLSPERLEKIPWLDTRADIVYPENWTSHRLNHLAAELGFINPFSHSALWDVATMLKIFESFDVAKIIERSQEPWVTLKACVSYEDRDKAKKRRFSWEQAGGKTYLKTWVKRVKKSDAEKEVSAADFQIVILEE